jgi:hypothetical protein
MAVTEKRTQLYLTARQHAALLRMARVRGTSLAGVVRLAIDAYLAAPTVPERTSEGADPLAGLVGCFEGPGDLSDNHDEYLYGPAADGPRKRRRERP